MIARLISVSPIGFEGSIVEVECDASKGLPNLQIVGMGNKAIDEAKDRVRSAITNSLLEFPTKRITINLAPAELPKDGAHFDLPIALAILVISGQLKQSEIDGIVFAGELALDGVLRPIRGAINITETARNAGYAKLYLPIANVEQAKLIGGIEVLGISSLKELYLHLKGETNLAQPINDTVIDNNLSTNGPFLDDIYGQDQAKRALIIATAGRHNILLNGPPGAGKTMLAQTLVNLLPPLTVDEQIATTKLHSLAGEIDGEILTSRPFRSPHHTTSRISITGGGTKPKPGEVSLAHLGVLFLDELPEYARATLESLRQPLEDKKIGISRINGRIVYPADFMLVATMNPCPCGFYGDSTKECTCTSTQVLAYQKKLSGPLLDRIDLVVSVSRVANNILLNTKLMQNTQHLTAVKKIEIASSRQLKRYNNSTKYNDTLTSREVSRTFNLSEPVKALLAHATDRLALSARSYFKLIKVARTIADLDDQDDISVEHLSEALQYRQHIT
jgi:magnesium chelatase family protein